MKNITYIICLTALLLSTSACDGFLAEKSQDEVRPGTTTDLTELMLKEVYPRKDSYLSFLDFMTDDVSSTFGTTVTQWALNQFSPIYFWQDDMFERMYERNIRCDVWQQYYARIKGCNVILGMINDVEGPDADKANLRGQALAMRSYYYFMLVNLFAQPYNASGIDINTALGVPLVNEIADHVYYPERASVAAVYERIETDLLEALPLLETYGKNNSVYTATNFFVPALLSRMYLYEEKWDKAIEYATKVIDRKPVLQKLANSYQYNASDYTYVTSPNVFDANSSEIIWAFSQATELQNYFTSETNKYAPFSVSPQLYGLYESSMQYDANYTMMETKDLRAASYYQKYYAPGYAMEPLYGAKGNLTLYNNNANKGIRVAEMYLNRAEAYARKYATGGSTGDRDKAINDLNTLREARYTVAAYVAKTAADFATPDELLAFCADERRRELNFEEHRWFDLRRYGMPELHHSFKASAEATVEDIVLTAGSKRYVLPIPKMVLDKNTNLVPNP